ncbi:MAG TPA: hypothetical protein VHW66_17340 [Stellaceae bacterium]|jgi:hypothetical protein|nr:hypothetical protein [Stellaceae bacterium]
MSEVRARIRVGRDHVISGVAPDDIPPGDHEALITLGPAVKPRIEARPFRVSALPTIDLGPWPEQLSLRREDIYGDDGR